MSDSIPDLWRTGDDVSRHYQLYLAHLQCDERYERIVYACRRIRQYAKRGPGIKEGLFTYCFEIDALCELKNYRAAWQQLRRLEYSAFGKRFNLKRGEFPPSTGMMVFYYYAPILYFLGKYRQGCDMLEHELGLYLNGTKYISYEMLYHVAYNNVKPSHRHSVTLSHFYSQLGKKLHEWKHWNSFVNGFHPSFFRILGVDRDALRNNSNELRGFLDKLKKIPREQIKKDGGPAILLKTAPKVRQQTESEKRKQEQTEIQRKIAKQARNARLIELFPELRGLLN